MIPESYDFWNHEIPGRFRSVDLVNCLGKTGNLAGSCVLMQNALGLGLVDNGSSGSECSSGSSLVACIYSNAYLLDSGLNFGPDRLIPCSSLCAGQDSLLGRFDVCHALHTSMILYILKIDLIMCIRSRHGCPDDAYIHII